MYRCTVQEYGLCGDMVEIETRCIIPIWRTFGRIQWHVPDPRITLQGAATCEFTVMISELHATLQGAVTWRNQCHDRDTLQGVRIPSAILKIVFAILFLNDERRLLYRLQCTCFAKLKLQVEVNFCRRAECRGSRPNERRNDSCLNCDCEFYTLLPSYSPTQLA